MERRDIDTEKLADIIAEKLADRISAKLCESISRQLEIDSLSRDKLLSAKEAAAKLGVSETTFCVRRIGDTIPSITVAKGIKRFPESMIIPYFLGML